jgi:hypothetical protein
MNTQKPIANRRKSIFIPLHRPVQIRSVIFAVLKSGQGGQGKRAISAKPLRIIRVRFVNVLCKSADTLSKCALPCPYKSLIGIYLTALDRVDRVLSPIDYSTISLREYNSIVDSIYSNYPVHRVQPGQIGDSII